MFGYCSVLSGALMLSQTRVRCTLQGHMQLVQLALSVTRFSMCTSTVITCITSIPQRSCQHADNKHCAQESGRVHDELWENTSIHTIGLYTTSLAEHPWTAQQL